MSGLEKSVMPGLDLGISPLLSSRQRQPKAS